MTNHAFLIVDCGAAIEHNPNYLLNTARQYWGQDLYRVSWSKKHNDKRSPTDIFGPFLTYQMCHYDVFNDRDARESINIWNTPKSGYIYWVHRLPSNHRLTDYPADYPNLKVELIDLNINMRDMRIQMMTEARGKIRQWSLKCGRYNPRYKQARAFRDAGMEEISIKNF